MSVTIPSGWYPDPSDEDAAEHRERWWNGAEWTEHTRPGQPAGEPYTSWPDAAPTKAAGPSWLRRNARSVVIAAVAAVLGAAVGSGITYAAVGGGGSGTTAQQGGAPRLGGSGGLDGGSGGADGGSGGQNGGAGGGSGRPASDRAVDTVDGIALPIPAGWDGGTDPSTGHAALTYGSYSCSQSKYGCSLGGVSTGEVTSTKDVKAAAEADIAPTAKSEYGTLVSHTQTKAEQVTVAGRTGYLIRWKVHPTTGNDGYVETVAFPTSGGSALATVHFGFDIAAKAPSPSLMGTILAGIQDYSGGSGAGAAS